MNTNSAFTGSFTENPFWYQKIDLRQNKIFSGGQPIVDFDPVDDYHLFDTTMEALNSKIIPLQFQLIISETTKYKFLSWLQSKMLVKNFISRTGSKATEAEANFLLFL